MADPITRSAEDLKAFCVRALCRVGVGEADACITAEVLVAADLRGVASHGVAHLRRYVDELQGLLRNAPKAAGRERIYIAGEKEQEALERNRMEGMPLSPQVAGDLDALARELRL